MVIRVYSIEQEKTLYEGHVRKFEVKVKEWARHSPKGNPDLLNQGDEDQLRTCLGTAHHTYGQLRNARRRQAAGRVDSMLYTALNDFFTQEHDRYFDIAVDLPWDSVFGQAGDLIDPILFMIDKTLEITKKAREKEPAAVRDSYHLNNRISPLFHSLAMMVHQIFGEVKNGGVKTLVDAGVTSAIVEGWCKKLEYFSERVY